MNSCGGGDSCRGCGGVTDLGAGIQSKVPANISYEQILSILHKKTNMHLTLTPAQAAKIAQMGSTMKGKGLIPENFDEDDFQDHSIVGLPGLCQQRQRPVRGSGGRYDLTAQTVIHKNGRQSGGP